MQSFTGNRGNDNSWESRGSKSKVSEQSRDFLRKSIDEKKLILTGTEMSRKVREYLLANQYLYSPYKGVYIIKSSDKSEKEVLDMNVYRILSFIGKDGWVFTGELVRDYHNGVTKLLREFEYISKTQNSVIPLGKYQDYIVYLKKSTAYREKETITIDGWSLDIETKLSYVVNNIRGNEHDPEYQNIANNISFMIGDIERFVNNGSNISNLSRLALLYKESGNIRGYSIIKSVLQQKWVGINYAVKGADKEDTSDIQDLFSSTLLDANEESSNPKHPKLVRFETMFSDFEKQIDRYLDTLDMSFLQLKWLGKLLSYIDKNKVYDTYHSLTIEAYNVTIEEISILNSQPDGKEWKEIEEKLIIKSYFHTFNSVVKQIEFDFGSIQPISHDFTQDIKNKLFSEFTKTHHEPPKNEYRKWGVRITGAAHIPPNPENLQEFMEIFLGNVNAIPNDPTRNILKKAILVHFFLAYIHPFDDGNGRTARFLMNYILASGWIWWLTVKSDEREAYIESLKEWSEKWNILPFTKFLIQGLKEAG